MLGFDTVPIRHFCPDHFMEVGCVYGESVFCMTVDDPLRCHDFFAVRNLAGVENLFNNRVHLGHKVGLRNEHMLPYLFGTRLGIDIIDLDQSAPLLGEALNFLAHIAFRGGVVLFVSRHIQTIPLVERTAVECGEYAYCSVWRRGTFTNSVIKFGAVTRLPDTVIFLSTLNNVFETHEAVTETAKMNIPSIGIIDSSCDPRLVTYPIPGNDDTPCAIELYCHLFKEAIVRGKAKAKEFQSSSSEENKQ